MPKKNNLPNPAVCGVTGFPLAHSCSPLVHQAGFAALRIPFTFIKLEHLNFPFVVKAMKEFNWRGLSITMPHKETALRQVHSLDPLAKRIGAINTIVNTNDRLKGYNTDALAIKKLLNTSTNKLKNKKVLIFGAGGAARAAIAVAQREGCAISVKSKTIEKVKAFKKQFDILPLKNPLAITHFDIIINATPVGMKKNDPSLFDYSLIRPDQIIFDFVYNPVKTPLIRAAEKKKAKILYGFEMFLEQAYEQFRLFTNINPPKLIMRKTLLSHLRQSYG